MSLALHIKASLELPTFIVNGYLEDLTNDDLFVRPAEKMNHLAWQLGHLIHSEHFHVTAVYPGTMPELPSGFKERYTAETAASENPADFHSKAEYIQLMQEQRQGTLNVLSDLSDEDLQKPSPETVRYLGPTIGCVFAGEATHWMMHAGQWAVIRRNLGKPPLY
ncbi:DinB family protein [Gimesia aquarii]|uniref:DinB superfamily protein n=1 Tax=Gimesia aquarii TaxID=2527964 RepID=A0A517WSH4_9PLAN|nr:DinB family protein [Gimesia aquarii]QDU08205.1 DinB superfamily protein [Gimesia aquarii]